VLDLVVFAALAWEAAAARAALRALAPGPWPRTWRGRLGDGGSCLVVQTGIGPQRAAAAAAAVPPAHAFLAFGCAGALVPDLRAGDLVVATEVLALDAAASCAQRLPAAGTALAAWAAAAGLSARLGPMASSAVVLADPAAKARAARSGALVVEMEALALAAAAGARGVPFASLRVVLDEVGEAVPDLGPALDEATGEVRPWRAALALATRPWSWPAVVRLARRQRVADARLRAAAARLFAAGARLLAEAPAAAAI